MIDRLKLFQMKNNGKLPERILIYRSGVSEVCLSRVCVDHWSHLLPQTQFNSVRQMELPLIVEAFKAFSPGVPYRPRLTIIVCNKSRQVRFYPTEQDDATSDGNPLPGTVVDRGITAIYDFDFFLQCTCTTAPLRLVRLLMEPVPAHGNRTQGTARPTHYYVIYDEIKFRANEIQGVTNALCYMFAPATQAVSMVAPAHYADLACRRGRCYLRKLFYGYVGEDGRQQVGLRLGVKMRRSRMPCRKRGGCGGGVSERASRIPCFIFEM